MAKSTRINVLCSRPGASGPGRLSPPLWASVSAALGAGEGATEGQPTTLLIFNPTPTPCPVGMFIHGPHLLAGRRHVSCSNAWSPQGARKMGHIPEDPPLPFPFAHVVSFGSSPVILSIPPTAQPFTCTRLSPGGSRLSPVPLPFCLSLPPNHFSPWHSACQ